MRLNNVSDGDDHLHDSTTGLPDSATGLHQSGASLLEHVKPYVSVFDASTLYKTVVLYM